MRVFLFALIGLVVAIAVGAAVLPMSMVAGMAASRFPAFKYAEASGRAWDGTLSQVSIGDRYIGDLGMKTDLLSLVTGKVAGAVDLVREGLTGRTDMVLGLGDGAVEVKDLTLSGNAALVPGMPAALALVDGKFTLDVTNARFVDNVCESASGEVSTDTLAKVELNGWAGPELRGPVTCAGGRLQVQAAGKAATGEDVLASLNIGQQLDMELTATVSKATPAAVRALTGIGFVAEGGQLVLRQGMGGR